MMFIHETNRIYLLDESDKVIAEVTFPNINSDLVNINHTYVDGSLRGQGIAGMLMEEAVTQIRENNQKAKLSCSYAIKWFFEHQECEDILAK